MIRRGLGALLALTVVSAGCGRKDPGPSAETSPEPPSTPFRWVPVRNASAATPEEYPARVLLTGGTNAVVVAPLPARVLTLLAKPGDSVQKDAGIARVVMPEADAATAALSAAETQLTVLSKRRAQLGSLEGEGLVKASDLAALDLDLARLSGEKARAKALLQSAGLSSGGITTLRSPMAGVITEIAATTGELRRPEDGPIARVRGHGGERIESTFASRPIEGAQYTFRAGGGSATPLDLVNVITKPSGTGYQVWFDAHDGATLPAAAEGRVEVRSGDVSGARLVPAAAVGSAGEVRFVVSRVRTSKDSAIVNVVVLRIASSDALVRGPLTDDALVASDPYQAQTTARPAASEQKP